MFVKLLGKKTRRKEDGGNGKLPFLLLLLLPPLHACPPMCVFMPALSHIFFVSRFPEHFFLHFRPTEKEARRQLDSFFYPPQPSSPFPFLTVFQSGFGRCIFFLFSRFLFFFSFFFAQTASVVWIFVQEVKRARRT